LDGLKTSVFIRQLLQQLGYRMDPAPAQPIDEKATRVVTEKFAKKVDMITKMCIAG
jgi:hypothetical protein